MANAENAGSGSPPPGTSPSAPPHETLGDDFAAQDRPGPGQAPPHVEKGGRLFTAAGVPVVRWKAGELPAIVDQAEAALMESGLQIYQRDALLVRVVKRSVPTIRNYKRDTGVLGLVTVDTPYLTESLTRAAVWEKFDGRSKEWVRTNAPEQASVTLLARSGHWKFPKLWGARSAPTLRPDGTVLQDPGYDAAMQVFYDPCGVEYPRVPERPTKADAERAFKVVYDAFDSFPYVGDADRAVALSFVLTALVRRSLPSAPLGAISAPMMGSGKTLLADCIAILTTGASAPAMTFAETDEEAKKTALAVLMEGDPVVLIDNVERPLEGDWLCSMLTSELYKQRMLGRTEMVSVPTRTLILATGNHLTVAGDLRTRTLLCQLDPKLEHPEQREFSYDLREKMIRMRPAIVTAALTVMSAFICCGESARKHVPPWGRFEHWSDMVRAPLVWMDCEDPCFSLRTLEGEDPMRNEHMRLVALWFKAFKDEVLTARAAIDRLNRASPTDDEVELKQVMLDVAVDKLGGISSKRLGKWLDRNKGGRIGGYLIEPVGHINHVTKWQVTQLETP